MPFACFPPRIDSALRRCSTPMRCGGCCPVRIGPRVPANRFPPGSLSLPARSTATTDAHEPRIGGEDGENVGLPAAQREREVGAGHATVADGVQ
jgi:hypothetical protein